MGIAAASVTTLLGLRSGVSEHLTWVVHEPQ